MRQLLFFDLPTETPQEKKEYRKFRKFLLNEGFLMLQFSVYSKLSLNDTQAKTILRKIEKNRPSRGSVVVLKVTEKQFANMTFVLGERETSFANSDERVIFLGERMAEDDFDKL
ncbi:CRISPR-associated protein Cas2 [Pilibacter termitis]|uniref:CRISPR-associated endoribonuclease Cas2 n=2 Tax=Pilibacter termitis TaxID=263852 RepID=A0A1T4LEF4_9ENTE|nr:CRISPR-associated protein Cas2 [Pilibacter termitis]